ncbi:MAG: FAD-binding oxidoreductase [Candidatus Marinimicrobia bacterium]|nr:FAD-binding oxidoreductase [Candidatus Neomarinimicrobiota bacterium]
MSQPTDTAPAPATDLIPTTTLLSPEEAGQLDAFARDHQGPDSLPAWAEFLKETFALELTCDPDVVQGFTADSSNLPGSARALGRPATARECAVFLRLSHQARIPCTVSAGRSNLTGSATPEDGLVLSLLHMQQPPIKLHLADGTASAPVGLLLEDFRKAIQTLSQGALRFPVDPTSRAEATLGGALACNASGFTPGAPGSIRDWVVALEALLPDGRRISATRGQYVSAQGAFRLAAGDRIQTWPVPRHPRAALKNAGGPFSDPTGVMDWIDLMVGCEGLFGIITHCTLKLAPQPAEYLDLFIPLPDESCALKLLEAVRAQCAGDLGRLSACEYFGVHCRQYMDHAERLFRNDSQVAVYLQVPLAAGETDDQAEAWFECLLAADAGVSEDGVLLLDNDHERAIFMEARHSLPAHALEVVQRHGTYTLMTDAVVPPARFAEFLAFTHARLAHEQLEYVSFGHLGDCHLHFTILPEKDQLARATTVYEAIIAESTRLGGVYSGEHGTGKRKRADFLACHGERGRQEVARCKSAVDPLDLLNRGNVIAPPAAS